MNAGEAVYGDVALERNSRREELSCLEGGGDDSAIAPRRTRRSAGPEPRCGGARGRLSEGISAHSVVGLIPKSGASTTTISTRRFCCLPVAVSFEAMG